ncbi:DUF5941 domain-containing protein [Kitasatospora kazusensis]
MAGSAPVAPLAPALAADLAALGFHRVLRAHDLDQLAALTGAWLTAADGPADPADRVAVVDAGFVGHRHALRLALTDPRFPAAAVPGAVVVAGAQARAALAAAASRLTTPPLLPRQPGTYEPGPYQPGPYEPGTYLPGPRHARPYQPGPREVVPRQSTPRHALPRDAGPQQGAERHRAPVGPAGARTSVAPFPEAPARPQPQPAPLPLPDLLAGALAQQYGIPVQRPELGTLVATVPATECELDVARAAMAEVDEEEVRLRRAVKARDGFFATFFVSPYSRYLARWCARRGLSPNQVTTASLVVALLAAACAATGTRPGGIAAGVLLLLSFVLDCADGQLARYALRYSTVGAWLDATFDRVKEYAFYAGLALGAARTGDHVWALALAAMTLMTFRHSVDFAFMAADQTAAKALPAGPTSAAGPAGPGAAGTPGPRNTSPTAEFSSRLDRVGWTVWARRIIVLPIGERWALIALLTACTTPRTALTVLLAGCALACCYTTAGRVLRSVNRRRPRSVRAAAEVATLADGGPLAELLAPVLRPVARRLPALAPPVLAALAAVALPLAVRLSAGTWTAVAAAGGYALVSALVLARRLDGALDWLAPAFFRAGEYLTVLALVLRLDVAALPAAFGLVAAVAYHHYDTVYRLRGGTGAPARWLVRATGGQEGRALLATSVAALAYTGSPVGHQGAGAAVTQGALVALAAVLALVVVAESIRFWVLGDATAEHDESGDTA